MKRVFISILAAAGLFPFSFANAAPPAEWRSVDAIQFDVAGIRIGMSYEQTLAKISEHFHLSSAESKQIKESTLYSYNRITKNRQPTSVTFKKDNVSLEVSFISRIPVNPSNPVAVLFIRYSLPNTPENVSMLKEAALSKYGPPSDSRRQANLMWCAHYNQISQCEPRKPKMALAFGTLVLDDYTLEDAAFRYEQDLLKTKPNL